VPSSRESVTAVTQHWCLGVQLLWTTEKETLFIIKNAGLFGTKAGEVYQVSCSNVRCLHHLFPYPQEGM
jgi:hypothetical protein